MNIFAFDPDPWTSALWLDDKRKNKMILETAQILSTVIHLSDPDGDTCSQVYKPTHVHHPCTKWATLTLGNFSWLVSYLTFLGVQKAGAHKSLDLLPTFDKWLMETSALPVDSRTPFQNSARNVSQGVDFTGVEDTHEAYRLYICKRGLMCLSKPNA